MKLILGLGNPGKQYENNRHNVGYRVIDELKAKSSKLKGVIHVKTNVFMNESGRAVKVLISQYPNIPVSNLYVVHDDLDIPLGQFKIQKGRGPKVHNGIKSVDEALGTRDYWRVRVGVDNRDPENRTPGEEYVLQDFTEEEMKTLNGVISQTIKALISKH